jgi:Rieske 2Fe-2S family protein
MQRTHPLQQFSDTRKPLLSARHMPGFVYESPEVYSLEKEKIFMRDWLCLGRVEEIPNPGDYMTFRIMDEPVIVVRNNERKLAAFANVCAHRGVEIAFGQGNTHRFKCPYHGWTYNLDGKLTGATFTQGVEGFDFKNCRLPTVQIGEWAGWFFVNFDPDCEPLERAVDEFEKDFGHLRQQDCALAEKIHIQLDCNWKFAVENVIDIYHIGVLHAKTKGAGFDAKSFKVEARRKGGYFRSYGDGPSSLSKKPPFGKMPWLQDMPDSYSLMGLLPPNFTMFARIDDVHPFIVWPKSPGSCELIIYLVYPKEFFARPDFRERVGISKEYIHAVLEEDRSMISSLQRAMKSKNFKPGPMTYLEEGVHIVINAYLERIYGKDG